MLQLLYVDPILHVWCVDGCIGDAVQLCKGTSISGMLHVVKTRLEIYATYLTYLRLLA